jgi:4-hydroxybenzoate polyprenyltransferase
LTIGLILFPFILGHKWNVDVASLALLAFFCFSFCASGTYLVNDLLDIEAVRHHLKKRLRPFAAGDLPVPGFHDDGQTLCITSQSDTPRFVARFVHLE